VSNALVSFVAYQGRRVKPYQGIMQLLSGKISRIRDAITSKSTNSPRPFRTPITGSPCLCPSREQQAWPSRAAALLSPGCRRLARRMQCQHACMQCESALSMADRVDEGRRSDVTNLRNKVVELLLGVAVLLGHVLVLLLPLVGGLLECLHLALVVPSLDVGLAEPVR
jgi:hypothetical protein